MKRIDTNKVFTQYRDIVTPTYPLKNRKYTMTHSDITGDLFVTVALVYADDLITSMQDQVLLHWIKTNEALVLYGKVIIDGSGALGNPDIRNKIFIKELPTALQAIRYGDRFLFNKYPTLDNSKILIKFISSDPNYNKLYSFGNIGMYQ